MTRIHWMWSPANAFVEVASQFTQPKLQQVPHPNSMDHPATGAMPLPKTEARYPQFRKYLEPAVCTPFDHSFFLWGGGQNL